MNKTAKWISVVTMISGCLADPLPPDAFLQVEQDDVPCTEKKNVSVCMPRSQPPVGSWSASFAPDDDCSCDSTSVSCHAIYVGSVDSIAGNQALLRFRKVGGGQISAPVVYWIVLLANDLTNCTQLEQYPVLSTGTWLPVEGDLLVSLDVWPSESACTGATMCETRKVGLVTGGANAPDSKIWFTKHAIEFSK